MFFSASSLSSLLGHLLRDAEPFDARKCLPRLVQWQQLIAVMPDGPQRFATMPGINSWGKHDLSDAQYGYPGNFAKGSLGIPRPFRETGTCSGGWTSCTSHRCSSRPPPTRTRSTPCAARPSLTGCRLSRHARYGMPTRTRTGWWGTTGTMWETTHTRMPRTTAGAGVLQLRRALALRGCDD
jgi:hypothetical protein